MPDSPNHPDVPPLDLAAVSQGLTSYSPREMMECLRFVPLLLDGSENALFYRWKTSNPRQGVVLIPLVQREGGLHLVLTQRHDQLRNHPGEVSFPGGRVEPNEDFLEAALRETEEEIGLRRDDVEVLGRLDRLYVPPSNFMVEPFTALVKNADGMRPTSSEVERILEFPLAGLFDPATVDHAQMRDREVDFYGWQGFRVWGATARMMNNLAEALGAPCDESHPKQRPPWDTI